LLLCGERPGRNSLLTTLYDVCNKKFQQSYKHSKNGRQHERFPEFFVVLNIKTNISANLSSKEKVTCLNDEGDIVCFLENENA